MFYVNDVGGQAGVNHGCPHQQCKTSAVLAKACRCSVRLGVPVEDLLQTVIVEDPLAAAVHRIRHALTHGGRCGKHIPPAKLALASFSDGAAFCKFLSPFSTSARSSSGVAAASQCCVC